jgi:hypothetical protein
MTDKNKKARASKKLQQIIEEAMRSGAQSIELQYEAEGLEVSYMVGQRGWGRVLTDRALAEELLCLIIDLAQLENKPRGVISWRRAGQSYPIAVEEYDRFGESAFRLKLGKPQKAGESERQSVAQPVTPDYTPLQGQYLAFIYAYTKIHRQPPAEADMQQYFRVTPPTVHQMVLTLERRGFIGRKPRQPRSIQVLLPPEQLPPLA